MGERVTWYVRCPKGHENPLSAALQSSDDYDYEEEYCGTSHTLVCPECQETEIL